MKKNKPEKRVIFTKKMKKEYKILVPDMLPIHIGMLCKYFNTHGYDMELLTDQSQDVISTGLKYVHNDTCYPALLVIGQLISALQSGKYDIHKTALMITQTGGGCRASNYIFLLRKALKKAKMEFVPVISFNVSGLEKNPGFKLDLKTGIDLINIVLYGDLLMLLKNQCLVYEKHKGDTMAKVKKWEDTLTREIIAGKLQKEHVRENYRTIVKDFKKIKRNKDTKVKVGIVGEIYVKFSPLGNNHLEDFLYNEDVEVFLPGLYDFCLYCVENMIMDNELYKVAKIKTFFIKKVYQYLINKQNELIEAVKEVGGFRAPTSFAHTMTLVDGYISKGAKMGEGWLLTAEMLEIIESGIDNVICTQPFGCLPNHIVGKGMMKTIKERNENANILAIDYDASASKINQENRIKLMLAGAKERLKEQKSK